MTILGVLFLFDSALLSLGNLLFCCGIPLTLGFKRSLKLCQKKPIQAVVYFIGVVLVLFGLGIFGFLFELVGLVTLFGPFARAFAN